MFLRRLLAAGCLAAGLCPAQTLPVTDPPAPFVYGRVNAVLVEGNTAYLGGSFSRIAETTGSFVVFDASTRQLQRGWPMVDGPINVAIPDGAIGFYIGGSFKAVGGLARSCLARIRADKTVDPTFNAGFAPETDYFRTGVGGIGRFAAKTRAPSEVYTLLLETHATRALVLSLPPGAYTALVRGVGGTSGVALVEAYEVP